MGPERLLQITDRLAKCDGSVIRWEIDKDGPVERLEVETRDALFCPFAIEVSAKGGADYGFHFGHGPHFDSLDPAVFDPLLVAEATIMGSVTERLWRLGASFVVKSLGTLTLGDGRVLSDTTTQLPLLAAFAHVSDISYRPYPSRR